MEHNSISIVQTISKNYLKTRSYCAQKIGQVGYQTQGGALDQ